MQPGRGPLEAVGPDLAQGGDAEQAAAPLAGLPAGAVLAVDQGVVRPGVDDEQLAGRAPAGRRARARRRSPGSPAAAPPRPGSAATAAWSMPPVGAPAISFSARTQAAASLVAPGVVVAEAEPGELVEGHRHGALQGGRRGQPGAERHLPVDDDVEARDVGAGLRERPGDAGDVAAQPSTAPGPTSRSAPCQPTAAPVPGPARTAPGRCRPPGADRRERPGAATRTAGTARRCSRRARRSR